MPSSEYIKTNTSFSGCDIVATIDLTLPSGKRITSVLGQIQTINYSTFMDKKPVRSLGNVNAKDYTYGPRTIAGTIIFTVFNRHWLHEIIEEYGDQESVSYEFLVDELPPFNITISMASEYGYQSYMAIYGIRLLSEGEVLSINDVYTENTYQFVATGLDYLKGVNSVTSGGKPGAMISKDKAASSAEVQKESNIKIPLEDKNASETEPIVAMNNNVITIGNPEQPAEEEDPVGFNDWEEVDGSGEYGGGSAGGGGSTRNYSEGGSQ